MSATDSILASTRVQVPKASANQKAAIFGVIGLAGLGATLMGIMDPASRYDSLNSYLVAFMFVATLAVGGLFFTILQYLVNAKWSVAVRRLAENMASTLPVIAILFLPLGIHVRDLWHEWARPEHVDPLVQAKAAYLNVDFFLIRAAFYLVTWAVLGLVYYRRSLAIDRTGDPHIILGLRKLAAPATLLFAITITFAGFDWVMSLDPTWYSTIFGVYIFAGTIVSTLSFMVFSALLAQRSGYLNGLVNDEHYHDLGKLIHGFIVFWAYIAFSQFFLIWYANLPEETLWYKGHWEGGWNQLTVALIFMHFVIPFFGIMSRNVKRNHGAMLIVSFLLIITHYADLFWIVMPIHRKELTVHWRDIAALLGTTGIFLATLFYRIGSAPLVPAKDPLLPASLEYDNG